MDRWPRLDVTGLLVFSGDHFAQVLEGPGSAIKALIGIESTMRSRSSIR
jgi:hypothetical protein